MSLKAKIEAVIYASEEPVTLAQLTGLLGEEGQSELDALAAQQQALALEAVEADASAADTEPIEDADALNAEILVPGEAPAEVPDAEAPAAKTAEPNRTPGEPAPAAADAEPAEKKLARDTAAEARAREAEQKLAARKLRDYFRSLLDELIADYATSDRGLEIREVAGGFRLATKPEYHDAVRGFVKSLKPPLKLSLQALETLAVVAYKQPVTAPEVSEIRGVDSAGVLGSLLTRKLVTTAGRKQVIGRPILYKTTKDFLLRFGLKDINELPSIEEFEKMAGELNETLLDSATDPAPDPALDPALETEAQEEIPMEAEAAEASELSEAAAIAEASSLAEAAATDGPDGFVADNGGPIDLQGHNLQLAEPDAHPSEPASISPDGATDGEADNKADNEAVNED